MAFICHVYYVQLDDRSFVFIQISIKTNDCLFVRRGMIKINDYTEEVKNKINFVLNDFFTKK